MSERKRLEGQEEGRFLRSLNAMYRHLDFNMKVAEALQRMSLIKSHDRAWTSEEEGRFGCFYQQRCLRTCRVNLMSSS